MSKYDDARAMREARFAPREEVVPAGQPGLPIVAPPPVVRAKADRSGAVPNLAPVGVCASCDKRRSALKVSLRRYRMRGAKA